MITIDDLKKFLLEKTNKKTKVRKLEKYQNGKYYKIGDYLFEIEEINTIDNLNKQLEFSYMRIKEEENDVSMVRFIKKQIEIIKEKINNIDKSRIIKNISIKKIYLCYGKLTSDIFGIIQTGNIIWE